MIKLCINLVRLVEEIIFLEFGIVKLDNPLPEWKLEAKEYVAVLSHSGSRGLGANIAKHYTYLASKQCPLPKMCNI